jgi:hypothetical protein
MVGLGSMYRTLEYAFEFIIHYHLNTKHKAIENIKPQGFCEGHIFNKVPWTIVAMPQKIFNKIVL